MATGSAFCLVIMDRHHYHTDKSQFYCGSSYLSVCCYCGRVQLIRYLSQRETPDLVSMPGPDCGSFVK